MATQYPRIPVEERARRYLALMPPAVSGSGGHTALFNVVRTLLHGFGFSADSARPLVEEYSQRCDPPWSASEINHKLNSVDGLPSAGGRGYLLEDIGITPAGPQRKAMGLLPETERKKQVQYDAQKLADLALPWRRVADLLWLANRSATDPAGVTAAGFLSALYPPGENILIFTDQMSQGDACWPAEALPTSAKEGVWFLPQPVDGEYHPNPRSVDKKTGEPKLSRRSEESVRAFRYMLLESDKAPPRDWLGFIVQVPLKIEALYTSGGRSIHALVRVDCRTKREWDAEKAAMMPFLMAGLMLGADRGTWSGVRLSRLPGCFREGKWGDDDRFQRYAKPKLQKLLYLQPGSDGRPICELPALRDVEKTWLDLAALGISDADEEGGATLLAGLDYYAPVSGRCREAAINLQRVDA
jgi:hypothetical protein